MGCEVLTNTVVVTNADLETEHYTRVETVFFINPSTHSDPEQLIQREGNGKVLFINAALALTVELS